ncbi:MAG: aldo/keto reductase family protein [Planctomycetes bacterium]|nr:aldo/keto reductase family protein [Planctomycetota bacterium]
MLYRNVGRSGLKVSAVGLGSWLTIGNAIDAASTARLVAAAFERGVNLFDTADVYAQGEGEKALGEAIRGLPRHRLVVATKCFFPMSDDPNDRGLSRKHVHESIRASLQRLGTDYVDLYQCHRFDPDVPLLETARAMDDLIRRGLVLYWGTSQWPAERLEEVVATCAAEGLHAPISNQPLYNLFDRGIEKAVLPTSARLGIGQIVYSPLAQGVLTGKYRPGAPLPAESRAADPRSNQFVGRYMSDRHLALVRDLAALAQRHETSAGRLALAFCLRDPRVSSVLVGARDAAQLTENLAAADIVVDAEVLAELDRIFPA